MEELDSLRGFRLSSEQLTSWIISSTLGNLAPGLEVNMPALCLSSFVLQGESEDGIALLDRFFSFSIGGCEGTVDQIESLGRGKRIYPDYQYSA